MGVLLQAAYRQSADPTVSVPSPADGDAAVSWWWDVLAAQARDFKLSGFTAVLLPPVLKTCSGQAPDADGYGAFDDYDLGNKNQFFGLPTRFGTREQLQRCIAVMHASGLDVYLDVVLHQRQGGIGGVYRYLAADGVSNSGRFPKDHGCFVGDPTDGYVPRDPVADPASDATFGDELAPVDSVPTGYVWDGLVAAGDWLTRSLDAQGYRIDDVKGLAVQFVAGWLTSQSMQNGFAVGEYFDGDRDSVAGWVGAMGGRASAFDFPVHFDIQGMCNNPGGWDMTQLDHAGLTGLSPVKSVTFVENADTDVDPSSNVVKNKMLGYAYILTSEGYPCVFYKDYAMAPGCYQLKPYIDNLVWIHENLAFGTTLQRWKDPQCFVFERQGYPNLLVGLNNDPGAWHTVNVQTSVGPNVQLHDYTGHAGDVWTDANGAVTIGVPPNVDGFGYVCYSRAGYTQPFSTATRATTQVFEGAVDLDLGPANNGGPTIVGRVWCASNTAVQATLTADATSWGADAGIIVDLVDATGMVLGSAEQENGDANATVSVQGVIADDWVTVRLQAAGLPDGGSSFAIAVTYTAPQGI